MKWMFVCFGYKGRKEERKQNRNIAWRVQVNEILEVRGILKRWPCLDWGEWEVACECSSHETSVA